MKFVPTSFKPKTVATVMATFQKAINDLLLVEQQSNAKYDLIEQQQDQRNMDHKLAMEALADEAQAVLTEADKAAKVRVKLEALLS